MGEILGRKKGIEMKLIKIEGNIWELTCLQNHKYVSSTYDNTPLEIKNEQTIKNLGWFRGIIQTIANHGIKSKAIAIIEIDVNGLPTQNRYEIYHNSKGFYCKIQKKRIFLIDLIK